MGLSIDYKTFKRLSTDYPTFESKGTLYVVLDHVLLVVQPTAEEYDSQKEEINQEINNS